MPRKDLKNKPLIEAILELKWALRAAQPGIASDPHYRILIGRLFERVKNEYPAHEALPTSTVPDEMVQHIVQHRFRAQPNAWPLVQLGPGILTINETAGYTWPDFQRRCEEAVRAFVDAYPAPDDLQIDSLALRYIDAVPLDFTTESVFEFLGTKMKTIVKLPDSLFSGTDVTPNPSAFNWQASFEHQRPAGTVTLRFATGHREGQPVVVWETLVASTQAQAPQVPAGFPAWLTAAHDITDDWFFKLIEGELERRFSGD